MPLGRMRSRLQVSLPPDFISYEVPGRQGWWRVGGRDGGGRGGAGVGSRDVGAEGVRAEMVEGWEAGTGGTEMGLGQRWLKGGR